MIKVVYYCSRNDLDGCITGPNCRQPTLEYTVQWRRIRTKFGFYLVHG